MGNYNKVVVTTSTYKVTDMVTGSTPICDTKILSGSSWSFASNELPATVYYESATPSKKLLLASQSTHVEMATGRTLEEDYTALLKQHGKEFVSTSGSITVPNGIRGKVISGEIKGQTVKNEVVSQIPKFTISSNVKTFTGINKLKSNTAYSIFINVKEITGTAQKVQLVLNDGTNYYKDSPVVATVGILKYDFTTRGETDVKAIAYYSSNTGETITVDGIVIVETSYSQYVNGIFTGLSSTQAVISNNGSLFPIYESTIQGKTRILKSLKGQNTWVEISSDEVRNTITYDYKLDSINGDLGSVPTVTDYVDRARKVKVINTKEVVLDYNQNWLLSASGYFYTTNYPSDIIASSALISNILVNKASDDFTIFSGGSQKLQVTIKSCKTVEQFKSLLQQQIESGTPMTVRYQLATPIEVQLTDEELKTYDAYKKLILLGKVGDITDTFEIKEDGSGVYTQNAYKKVLTGIEAWQISSIQVNGYSSFYISGTGSVNDNGALTNWLSDLYPSGTYQDWANAILKEFIQCSNNTCGIRVLSARASTVEQFKQLLQSNPVTVYYKLATPVVTVIPKELMPVIQVADKINICSVDSPVAASSFSLTLPTSDGVAKEFDLTPQNSWAGTLKAQLLQTGRIRIKGVITVPSTYVSLIANLPAELKPSVARKIVGFNGNTPVAITVDTVQSIKCPTTVTGTIEIDDEYEI